MTGSIRQKKGILAFFCYFFFLYLIKIPAEPLMHWDARSIWFFHAKMIREAGSIGLPAGWQHPSLQWSHADYPKLIPALAAQLGLLRQKWNEYLPKLSLFLLFLPALFWITALAKRRFSFAFLAIVSFFGTGFLLWNGYMDGYLALYASLAILHFGLYWQERNKLDFLIGLCSLGIITNLKNEGLVFTFCLFLASVVALKEHGKLTLMRYLKPPVTSWILLITAAPATLWSLFCVIWPLKSWIAADTSPEAGVSGNALHRLIERLTDGHSARMIFEAMTFRLTTLNSTILLTLIALMTLLARRRRIPTPFIFALATSLGYFAVLYLVYLTTPLELQWHLSTSVGRTVTTVQMGLMIGVFFLMRALEEETSG
jgi:hypothetical protein